MGSARRTQIVHLSSISVPEKFHCEIVNVKPVNSVPAEQHRQSIVGGGNTEIGVSCGRNIHPHSSFTASALQSTVIRRQHKSVSSSSTPFGSSSRPLLLSQTTPSTNNTGVATQDCQKSVIVSSATTIPNATSEEIATDGQRQPEEVRQNSQSQQRRQRRRLLSIFSKSKSAFHKDCAREEEEEATAANTSATVTSPAEDRRDIAPVLVAEKKTAPSTKWATNNDKKTLVKNHCSIVDVRRVAVHRVHFNCQTVSVVSLDGNNNVREVKTLHRSREDRKERPKVEELGEQDREEESNNCGEGGSSSKPTGNSFIRSPATTFGHNIVALWSNSSNKFRQFAARKSRQSEDKGRSNVGGDEKLKEIDCKANVQKQKGEEVNIQQIKPKVKGEKKKGKEEGKSKQTIGVINMSSYVEKRSSVGLTKPLAGSSTPATQLQQCPKEQSSHSSAHGQPFGFSRSSAALEHEPRHTEPESDTQAPALPPKGISRLPTFFSKLTNSSNKVKASGIPAPKLLSSKSIGNVSIDIHCDLSQSSAIGSADKHQERRASFVSTNSCDNISTASGHSKNSRVSSKLPQNAAKKAQSTHNVSVPSSKIHSQNDNTKVSTKSVGNLSNVATPSLSQSKTSIPRSSGSRGSLTGSRSKMDQIGGRITETITDRSTVGIPIRAPDKFVPTRKSCSALQASAARFQQHQNQIYSQRMSFFGVPSPATSQHFPNTSTSSSTFSQVNHGGGGTAVNRPSSGDASVLNGNRPVASRLAPTAQSKSIDSQQLPPVQQKSLQNGNGRYSPHKSYNPYNRPLMGGHQQPHQQSAASKPLPTPPSHLPPKQIQPGSTSIAALNRTQKEQELQSVNYVRDVVSRYQSQVMNSSARFTGSNSVQYPGKSFQHQSQLQRQPQQPAQQQYQRVHSQPLSDNYNTYTKKVSKEHSSGGTITDKSGPVLNMDKRDEMSFVAAMVSDCQMRQQIHLRQQQQKMEQRIGGGDCATARASVAIVNTTDDTDVEEEIEEMKHLERAPSGLLYDNPVGRGQHQKCEDDLSVTSIASSSSSFVRHSESHPQQHQHQHVQHGNPKAQHTPQQLRQQQHSHSHSLLNSDAFPHTTGSSERSTGANALALASAGNANAAVESLLTSSTHSALSTSTTSSFCFEPPTQANNSQNPQSTTVSTSNPMSGGGISRASVGHLTKLHQPQDNSASSESSATGSPSFHKVRTASSATTASQESNRDLFFDDEIADQPDLLIMNNNNNNNINQHEKDNERMNGIQNRAALRLSLAKSHDNSSGSSSTTTTMAQESLNPSPLTTPTNNASIRTANTELESLMQQISLNDREYSSLNHCPVSPARKAFFSHREVDRSRSFSFQHSSPTSNSHSITNQPPSSANECVTSPRVSGLKKRHSYTSSSTSHVFRKPRPLSFVENEDGSLAFDSPSMRAITHDIIGLKTLLFRLQGVLQNAETQSPFESRLRSVTHPLDTSLSSRSSLDSAGDSIAESRSDTETAHILREENLELRQHIQSLEQEALEKDRTIRLLQQQMAKYTTGFDSNHRSRTNSSTHDFEQNR